MVQSDHAWVWIVKSTSGKACCLHMQLSSTSLSKGSVGTLVELTTAAFLFGAYRSVQVYMPCVYALNKIDAITMEELDILDAIPHYCPISVGRSLTYGRLLPLRVKKFISSLPCLSSFPLHVPGGGEGGFHQDHRMFARSHCTIPQ
eukprot:scaffold251703_cov27-Tisochrysis_lutea.AAC.2